MVRVTTDRPAVAARVELPLDRRVAARTMFGVCQAGLVNNLNDGICWGVLPLPDATLYQVRGFDAFTVLLANQPLQPTGTLVAEPNPVRVGAGFTMRS